MTTARYILGWTSEELARSAKVPVSSVFILARFGSAGPDHDRRLRAALEAAGIEFLDTHPGQARLRRVAGRPVKPVAGSPSEGG